MKPVNDNEVDKEGYIEAEQDLTVLLSDLNVTIRQMLAISNLIDKGENLSPIDKFMIRQIRYFNMRISKLLDRIDRLSEYRNRTTRIHTGGRSRQRPYRARLRFGSGKEPALSGANALFWLFRCGDEHN